ncbi:MAG: NAD-binding protein [Candidatus Marsarchaeota archaeon]|nr:NAD-binding protein [Candidatus Marsarchaeota archaeon]
MKAEQRLDNEKVPISYITALIVIVVVATILSIIFVKDIVSGITIYTAAYFVASTLFDVVGVDAASIILSRLSISGIGFEKLLPILIVDGIIKIVILGFVLAGVVDLIMNINIRDRIIKLKIKHSKSITIIAGYSTLSEKICDILYSKKSEFVVIDRDNNYRDIFITKGYNYVFGDFTDQRVLREAGIMKASSIIFAIGNDFENSIGIISSRDVNKDIRIVARAEQESSAEKMGYLGADTCIVPEAVTAVDIANTLIKVTNR